jgi:hypothetical protein
MFYVRSEGDMIRNGFNFYPMKDTDSRGFIFRLGIRALRVRYSIHAKKWFVQYHKFDADAYKNFMNANKE